MSSQVSKQEALSDLLRKISDYEKKYQMSTEEFLQKVAGTPAEDEPDFIEWLGYYESYQELKG